MPFDAPAPPADEIDAAPKAAGGGLLARARALVERQLHIVGKLAEIAIGRARAMRDRMDTPPDPPPASAGEARRALSFLAVTSARVSRAVRLAVLLRQRLVRDLKKLHRHSLADAERILSDIALPGLGEKVTLNAALGAKLQALAAAVAAAQAGPAAAAAQAADPEDEPEPLRPGERIEVIESYVLPIRPPSREAERRRVDPLRAYVRSRPVSDLIDEICIELDLPLDTRQMMEQLYELQAMQARNLPPLGEVPAAGRGRGLKRTAPPPPSAAARPPEGEDLPAVRREPAPA